MPRSIVTAAVLACALSAPAFAQSEGAADTPLHAALDAPDNLKLSGTFRVRIEGIDDQFRPAPEAPSSSPRRACRNRSTPPPRPGRARAMRGR